MKTKQDSPKERDRLKEPRRCPFIRFFPSAINCQHIEGGYLCIMLDISPQRTDAWCNLQIRENTKLREDLERERRMTTTAILDYNELREGVRGEVEKLNARAFCNSSDLVFITGIKTCLEKLTKGSE